MHRNDNDLEQSARDFLNEFTDAAKLRADIAESREEIIRLELAHAALAELQNIVSHNGLDEAVKNAGNIRRKEGRGHIGLGETDQYFQQNGSFYDAEDNPYRLINEKRYTDAALMDAHGIEGQHSMRERIVMDAIEFDIGARLMLGEYAKYLKLDISAENVEQQQEVIDARKKSVFHKVGAIFNRVGTDLQMSDPASSGFSEQFKQVLAAELKDAKKELDQHNQIFRLAEKGALQVEQNLEDKQAAFFRVLAAEANKYIDNCKDETKFRVKKYGVSPADKKKLETILATPGEGIMPFFKALLKECSDNGFILAEGDSSIPNEKLIGSVNVGRAGSDYFRLLAALIKFSYSNMFESGTLENQAQQLGDAEKLIIRSACMVNTTEVDDERVRKLSAFRVPSMGEAFEKLPQSVKMEAGNAQRQRTAEEKQKEKVVGVKSALFNRDSERLNQDQNRVRPAVTKRKISKGR